MTTKNAIGRWSLQMGIIHPCLNGSPGSPQVPIGILDRKCKLSGAAYRSDCHVIFRDEDYAIWQPTPE